MRENPPPAYVPAAWKMQLQQHAYSYQLVEKGVITFHSQRCTGSHFPVKNSFFFVVVCFCFYICTQNLPVSPSSPCSLSHAYKSQQTAPKCTRQTGQTNILQSIWVSELLTSQWLLSWFNRVRSWGRYEPSRAAEQQPCIYTHRLTDRLTDWLTLWLSGRLDDWKTDYHSAGGSRAESHSP